MGAHRRGCRSFWTWSAAGFLVVFSILTGLSIGLFVLPVAAVAVFVAARLTTTLAEGFGAVTGAGAVCILVAALNASGDGVDPTAWLAAGVALATLGVGAYGLTRRS
jgi:hypothetical protein